MALTQQITSTPELEAAAVALAKAYKAAHNKDDAHLESQVAKHKGKLPKYLAAHLSLDKQAYEQARTNFMGLFNAANPDFRPLVNGLTEEAYTALVTDYVLEHASRALMRFNGQELPDFLGCHKAVRAV